MIKEKEVEVTVSKGSLGYYRKIGYNCNIGDKLILQIENLPHRSNLKITAICDNCGKEKQKSYDAYMESVESTGSYFCKECSKIKVQKKLKEAYKKDKDKILERRRQTCLSVYGVENPMQLEEIRQRQQQTNIERYGYSMPLRNPMIQQKMRDKIYDKYGYETVAQVPEIQERRFQTNIDRYGSPFPSQNSEVKEKVRNTIREHLGVDYLTQSEEIKSKIHQTMYKNGSCPTSSQQIYLHKLYGGELNYPLGGYSLDIAFPDEKLEIEYSGGGHNLKVQLGYITPEEFQTREIIRGKYVRGKGWKTIHIITPDDKLPSDKILLQMLDISKQYFKDYPNHSWFEWLIDDGIYRNAEHKDGVLFNYGEFRYIKANDKIGNLQSFKTA